MKSIAASKISSTVAELCVRANVRLRPDVVSALKKAYCRENSHRAKELLRAIIANAAIAQRKRLAICQDTGMPVVFLEIGQEIRIIGDLYAAVQRGIEAGYRKGFLRNSIVRDPLTRGRPSYTPAVIHTDIVKGNSLKITVFPKGFGCENKSQLKMFKPTAELPEIKQLIIDAVKSAGPDACPPYIVGVGIGGTSDYAALLAKKALLRKITYPVTRTVYPNSKIEDDLLQQINRLNIGPMGLGGKTTALAVHIETYPTHIAGLPVAVNLSCHALRSASQVL
ncbi:MAG: fumarate hydratase [Candidatus Omnitrophica bacterium]|nr:fumarate hydratase [Candidatus Omnitrophota bacterium]